MVTEVLSKSNNVTRLEGVRWETYQALLWDLAESSHQKLTFNQGILEIMTPLPEHEINKSFLGCLVRVTTEVLGLEIASLGSTTLSRKDLQKGIEPDECFYIQNEPLVRGKFSFDFTMDPPPDLAIEVDITSTSLNRLTVYEALGVKEIWRFDGKHLVIYCLEKGVYEIRENSQVLSILSKQIILDFLNKRREIGENALLREFRQHLQRTLHNQ
ncbi:Uma2 family endonuclease [Cyanobacterium stanieri LEGE 03274]|uniref:Uma2 family endonuclease n=1 Tax=Cyanobacterium stanieri LEGE 03274 TaxID=1828756 RepID=A0ABR9V7B9_9CHRO|nr:Uma2 family endonuclease [Cyanobacterium stanieri]MBE9223797.1 Uma2 family endonuclease [Cyanobacterium stanieri LEGE 03274]